MKLNRSLLLLAVFVSFAAAAVAQGAKQPCTSAGDNNPFLGIETIRLWPGDAPDAKGKACEDIPTLTVFSPSVGSPSGPAIVILPGGAHLHLSGALEGRDFAAWFAARGFTAFVLQYRLGPKYIFPTPLYDARRAIQLVRARAADYHLDPNRIGIIGFSAGGHLAALAGTRFVPGDDKAADAIDRVSSRPDFMVLGYPWIDGISLDYSHLNYCKLMKVEDRCDALTREFNPTGFVTKDTPPTFWYHTADDHTVPIAQGLHFYEALLKAGVPVEAHIFAHGAHGSGEGKGDPALDQWTPLLETWLRANGLIPAKK